MIEIEILATKQSPWQLISIAFNSTIPTELIEWHRLVNALGNRQRPYILHSGRIINMVRFKYIWSVVVGCYCPSVTTLSDTDARRA